MLKKIISIKNVGRFRNSAAAGNPQLTKYTLVLGGNGFGKTTICAVLRSLKTGDASHIIGRRSLGVGEAPTVDLLLDGGPTRFDGTQWSTLDPSLEIFDGVFVAENVHSGDVVEIEHKRNFYRVIVGAEGVRLAEEDTSLATLSREKTGEVTSAVRAIQPHIPGEMRLESFISLPRQVDIDRLIEEQRRRVESIRESAGIQARSPLTEFSVPNLPANFDAILSRSMEKLSEDAEALVSKHLARHGMETDGRDWIAQGVQLIRDETCPFCGQAIKGLQLIAAYRAIFSEQYNTLKSDISATQRSIEQAFGDVALARLETIAEQNRSASEFWARYCTFDTSIIAFLNDADSSFRALRDAALALLQRKAGFPLDVITPDGPYNEASARYIAAKQSLEGVNAAIRAINVVIAAKKVEVGSADVRLAEAELARLQAVKARHSDPVSGLCDQHTGLVAAKAAIDQRRANARDALDRHTQAVVRPYERRINEFLESFNADFSIAETRHTYPGGIATSTYQLVINRTNVDVGDGRTPPDRPSFKNTLSSGDRTTLALAFFFANLERDSALASKTVVFDDPFNSQDAFRRRQTVHEIARLAGGCAQVIILSHDATFLKQIAEKAPASEITALNIADQRSQGSKLLPIDLDKATQGRTATDIDQLQTYLTTGAGNLLDLIRKMRVVLETYCRTTYPSSFLADDWLGDMVRKIREGGDAHPAAVLYDELDQINDYTKQYHHGEDVHDTTPDQIDSKELTGYVRRTLKIVNALQA